MAATTIATPALRILTPKFRSLVMGFLAKQVEALLSVAQPLPKSLVDGDAAEVEPPAVLQVSPHGVSAKAAAGKAKA